MGRTSLIGVALLLGRPAPSAGLEMTEEGVRRAVASLFARHGYENVDPALARAMELDVLWSNRELFLHVAGLATHPELLPHVERYDRLKREALGEGVRADVRVVFGRNALGSHRNDGRSATAWCEPLTRTVFIDRGFWESVAEHALFRESIVFHELGHCDLDRGHDSDLAFMDADDAYFSLMDGSVKSRLLWPGFNAIYAVPATEALFNEILEKRFGGDLALAHESMVAELFSRRGTVGKAFVDGRPAPAEGLYRRFAEFIVPMLRDVEMRYATEGW